MGVLSDVATYFPASAGRVFVFASTEVYYISFSREAVP